MSYIIKPSQHFFDKDSIVLQCTFTGSDTFILTEEHFNKPLHTVTKQDIFELAEKYYREGNLYDFELAFDINVNIKNVSVLDHKLKEHLLFKCE